MRDPATFSTDAEREGYAAFLAGKSLDDAPHAFGSPDFDRWAHGFGCAETDSMGFGE